MKSTLVNHSIASAESSIISERDTGYAHMDVLHYLTAIMELKIIRSRIYVQDLKPYKSASCFPLCSLVSLGLKLKLATFCAVVKTTCLDLRRCLLFGKFFGMGSGSTNIW